MATYTNENIRGANALADLPGARGWLEAFRARDWGKHCATVRARVDETQKAFDDYERVLAQIELFEQALATRSAPSANGPQPVKLPPHPSGPPAGWDPTQAYFGYTEIMQMSQEALAAEIAVENGAVRRTQGEIQILQNDLSILKHDIDTSADQMTMEISAMKEAAAPRMAHLRAMESLYAFRQLLLTLAVDGGTIKAQLEVARMAAERPGAGP